MPAKLVTTVRTTYTQSQMIKAFVEAWKDLYGVVPKKESIGVIWAQNALETGLTKAMWNNNIGNIKYVANASDTEDIQYCMLANVWEIINGKKVIFQPPHPATWFRSFDSLEAGVVHHFNFLKNKRYKQAWTAVEAGDPALFAHLLKIAGYYTAPESAYVKSMNYYFNQYMAGKDYENAVKSLAIIDPVVVVVPPKPEPSAPEPTPEPAPVEPEPITKLPDDHKPIDVVPVNSDSDVKSVNISFWHKVEVSIYNFLSTMPWIKLIEWLTSPKKQ